MCIVCISVMCDVSFVNNTPVICQNPKVTAINSCIEVDLTGQVVSDSIGTRMYSGEIRIPKERGKFLRFTLLKTCAATGIEIW